MEQNRNAMMRLLYSGRFSLPIFRRDLYIYMWNILMHFLTFTGGVSVGVVLMCLLQAGKQADEEFEQAKRNSQWNE